MTIATAPSPSGRTPYLQRAATKETQFAVLLVLPAVALLLAISCYPLVASLTTSLFRQSLVQSGRRYVGLQNFELVLQEQFLTILWQTVIFTIFATVLPFLIGLGLALALNCGLPGQSTLRGVFLLPWVLPGVVVSFIWLWIFNANYGLLNGLLSTLGLIDENVAWLSSPLGAMVAVIVAKTWSSFPWMMVMLLAAMQTVPGELYEAAKVDGAGAFQRLTSVTLPWIRGTAMIVLLLEFIWNLQHFDTIYVLTGGGPAGSTTTFAVAVYNTAFKGFDLGKAGALGALWLVLLTGLVLVYLRLSEREVR